MRKQSGVSFNPSGGGRGFSRGGRFPGRGRGQGRGRSNLGSFTGRWQSNSIDGKRPAINPPTSSNSTSNSTSILKRKVSKVETNDDYYGDYYGPFPPQDGGSAYYDTADEDEVIEPTTLRASKVSFSSSQPSQRMVAFTDHNGSKFRRLTPVLVRHVSLSHRVYEGGGRAELDSHADNCLLGRDAYVMEEYIGEKFHLFGYKTESGFAELHTMKAALAYDMERVPL